MEGNGLPYTLINSDLLCLYIPILLSSLVCVWLSHENHQYCSCIWTMTTVGNCSSQNIIHHHWHRIVTMSAASYLYPTLIHNENCIHDRYLSLDMCKSPVLTWGFPPYMCLHPQICPLWGVNWNLDKINPETDWEDVFITFSFPMEQAFLSIFSFVWMRIPFYLLCNVKRYFVHSIHYILYNTTLSQLNNTFPTPLGQ